MAKHQIVADIDRRRVFPVLRQPVGDFKTVILVIRRIEDLARRGTAFIDRARMQRVGDVDAEALAILEGVAEIGVETVGLLLFGIDIGEGPIDGRLVV